MGDEHDSWLRGLKSLVGAGGDGPGDKVPIPALEIAFMVPVPDADLGYIDAGGSAGFKFTCEPAEEGDSAMAIKFANGKPSYEAALKKKYGENLTVKGGGEMSGTGGAIGIGVEIPGVSGCKTTVDFKVIKVDANKVKVEFAVVEWESTFPIKDDKFTMNGIEIKCQGSVAIKVEVSPNKTKIAAELAKRYGTTLGEEGITLLEAETFGVAIEAGLLVVAVGTVAGVIDGLAKAIDMKQLSGQVMIAKNQFRTGMEAALRGDPTPGGGWFGAGWKAGKTVFDQGMAKGRAKHPDWDEFAIRDKVIDAAARVSTAAEVKSVVDRRVGEAFWKRWIAANHGVGTFLGDAQEACTLCFAKAVVGDTDPDLDAWKKVSQLPEFMK